MKIAIIGYFETQFYGSMAEWVANAWQANGHEVFRIDRSNIVIPQDADIVFFEDCSEDFSANIPEGIKQPKVCWMLDSHMPGGTERSVNIARKCDLTFSMNYEHGVKLLEKFGIESIWMPSTYDNTLIAKRNKKLPNYDVCMIGHPNSRERVELWDILNKNFRAFTGKAGTREEYINAMRNCNIVVNQPTEPWDIITGIRFFEALGFGKLCLQKKIRTQELEKLGFKEFVDFVYWEGFDDLTDKLRFYLDNELERERMAENGHQKVQKMSMQAQAAKMEQIILSKFYDRL